MKGSQGGTFSFTDLVTWVLNDPVFRRALRRDPARALSEKGIEPTPALIEALKAFDWESAQHVYQAFRGKALMAEMT